MNETELRKQVQVTLTQLGARLFRNNTGALKNSDGRWVQFGLCEGSADLIGWMPDGRFLAVETKAPGQRTAPKRLAMQLDFLAAVNKAGGVGFMPHSLDEAILFFRMGLDKK